MSLIQSSLFIFAFSLLAAVPSLANGGSCQSIFLDAEQGPLGLRLNNFQETLALLYLSSGQHMTQPILEQLGVFESLKKVDSRMDLLSRFNLQKYETSDGKHSLRWAKVDLADSKAASKALVRMSRLVALEQFSSLRKSRTFIEKIVNLKADTLARIETELYLKALLQAEGHFAKSGDLNIFLPWNILRLEKVRLDQKMIDALRKTGLEGFHEAVASRYGWRVSTKILQETTKNILKLASVVSIALIIYYYQRGDDYFDKLLRLETGLSGEDFNLFSEMLEKSGLKTSGEVIDWLSSQKTNDPDMDLFIRELRQELQK